MSQVILDNPLFQRWFWGTLYGLASALIVVGTSINVTPGWPDAWGWVKLAAGGGLGFGFGVFLYMKDPQKAWDNFPKGHPD